MTERQEFFKKLADRGITTGRTAAWDLHCRRINTKPTKRPRFAMAKIYTPQEWREKIQRRLNSRYSVWGSTKYLLPAITSRKIKHPATSIRDTGFKGYVDRRSTLKHHLYVESAAVIIGRGIVAWADGKLIAHLRLPVGWAWKIDADGFLLIHAGEMDFHPDINDIQRTDAVAHCIRQAKKNQINRLRAAKIKAIKTARLGKIWVSAEDSYAAGNCKSATNSFAETLQQRVGAIGEIGAVRADFLLAIRNDSYTARAIAAASKRYAA